VREARPPNYECEDAISGDVVVWLVRVASILLAARLELQQAVLLLELRTVESGWRRWRCCWLTLHGMAHT